MVRQYICTAFARWHPKHCYQPGLGNTFLPQPSTNCASCGLLSNDLISHSLRWNSLPWLLTEPPPVSSSTIVLSNTHHIAVCNTATQTSHDWIEDRHHSFSSLCRITAWVLILISSLRARKKGTECLLNSSLTTNEI